jgi:hypothetical protein
MNNKVKFSNEQVKDKSFHVISCFIKSTTVGLYCLMSLLRWSDPDELLLEVPRDRLVAVDEDLDRFAQRNGRQLVHAISHLKFRINILNWKKVH